jgi:hypothetical protein
MKEIKGLKYDSNKLLWNLLPYKEVEEIVEILTFGAAKYSAWNFAKVEDWKDRYFAALMRHVTSYWNGEAKDLETGKSHLAHAGCCLLFLMYMENKGSKNVKRNKTRR